MAPAMMVVVAMEVICSGGAAVKAEGDVVGGAFAATDATAEVRRAVDDGVPAAVESAVECPDIVKVFDTRLSGIGFLRK